MNMNTVLLKVLTHDIAMQSKDHAIIHITKPKAALYACVWTKYCTTDMCLFGFCEDSKR